MKEHVEVIEALSRMTLREMKVMRKLLDSMIEKRTIDEVIETYKASISPIHP
jgi:hypothetical protein